jgi:glycosyltransferase involved in cell wall biosynthesis
MQKTKQFTIIICTFNSQQRLALCVQKILQQQQYVELVEQLIIVNNNSTDNTQQVIDSFGAAVRPLYEHRQGLAYARLCGARAAQSPWIIYLDDDNLVAADWLINAATYIKEHPRVGAFNGAVLPLIQEQLSLEEQERLEVCYRRLACSHLDIHSIGPLKNHLPIGAGLVVKSEPIHSLIKHGWIKRSGRVGAQLFGGEDIEISLFIRAHGYEFGFCPQMIIHHVLGAWRLKKQYLIELFRNNDIELELRSARFGRFGGIYLIGESCWAVIKYYLAPINPFISRKKLFALELAAAQALEYLNNLRLGKKLPGTVRQLGGPINDLGRREYF